MFARNFRNLKIKSQATDQALANSNVRNKDSPGVVFRDSTDSFFKDEAARLACIPPPAQAAARTVGAPATAPRSTAALNSSASLPCLQIRANQEDTVAPAVYSLPISPSQYRSNELEVKCGSPDCLRRRECGVKVAEEAIHVPAIETSCETAVEPPGEGPSAVGTRSAVAAAMQRGTSCGGVAPPARVLPSAITIPFEVAAVPSTSPALHCWPGQMCALPLRMDAVQQARKAPRSLSPRVISPTSPVQPRSLMTRHRSEPRIGYNSSYVRFARR